VETVETTRALRPRNTRNAAFDLRPKSRPGQSAVHDGNDSLIADNMRDDQPMNAVFKRQRREKFFVQFCDRTAKLRHGHQKARQKNGEETGEKSRQKR
jgi:hypothetical protein